MHVSPPVETSPVGYGFLAGNPRSDIFKLNFMLHQLATPATSRSHADSPFISNEPNAYNDSQLFGINSSVADQVALFATFHLRFSSLPPGRPPEWLWLLSQYLIDIYNELALSLAFGVPVPLRVGVLLAIAFAWALNAFAIGREAERHDTPAEAAPILQTSERIGGGRAGGDDGPGGAGDTGGTALVLRAFACAALGLLAVGFSVVSVAVCARRGICQAGSST